MVSVDGGGAEAAGEVATSVDMKANHHDQQEEEEGAKARQPQNHGLLADKGGGSDGKGNKENRKMNN